MEGLVQKQPWVKNVKIIPETTLDDNRFELAGTCSYLLIDNLSDSTVQVQLGACEECYPLGAGMQIEFPVHAIHIEYLSFTCESEADIVVLAGVYSCDKHMDW